MNNNTVNPVLQEFYNVAIPVYAVAIPIMITVCVLAFLANLMVLISCKWVRDRFTPTLKLTFSLAAADAWTSLVIMEGLVVNSYLPYVLLVPKSHRQDCASYAMEAFRLGGMVTSVLHLLTMSLNHYAATALPVQYRIWSAKNWITWLMLFLWLIPPGAFLLVFVAYSDETFNAQYCNPQFLEKIGFRLAVFTLIFVPLGLMTVVYVKIAFLLSILQRQTHGRSASQHQQKSLRRKAKTIITALLIVSTFLIGWVPSIAFFAITCQSCIFPSKELIRYPRLMLSLTIGVNMLMIMKGLLNPLIYGFRIPEIQKAILSAYCCCWKTTGTRQDATDVESSLFHLSQRARMDPTYYCDESIRLYDVEANESMLSVRDGQSNYLV